MNAFSKTSIERLKSCDERLQRIAIEVIRHQDCSIIEGHRSDARQDDLFRTGQSRVQAGHSKHNAFPSLAMDIAPYPIDWNDRDRFLLFVGRIQGIADMMGIKIRVGADWDGDGITRDQAFHDLPHIELAEA